MEARRSSKKTRSYGGAPKSPRDLHNVIEPSSESRTQSKERVKSAPLGIPQTHGELQEKHSQSSIRGRVRGESQASESNIGSASSDSPLTAKQPVLQNQRHSAPSQIRRSGVIQEVTLVVLGTPRVGKSSFVHCALDLKKPAVSPISSKKVALEGRISLVRLLELGLDEVKVTEEERVRWPEKVGDQRMLDVDGVLALYDVMDRKTVATLPRLLQALSKDAIPTLMVATKCDNPSVSWKLYQDNVEDLCSNVPGLEIFQTSASAPETQKRCISVLLRNIMLDQCVKEIEDEEREREQESDLPKCDPAVRPRASTGTRPIIEEQESHSTRGKIKHIRAASEAPVPSSGKQSQSARKAVSTSLETPSAAVAVTKDYQDSKRVQRTPSMASDFQKKANLHGSPDIDSRESASKSYNEDEQGTKEPSQSAVPKFQSHLSSSSGTVSKVSGSTLNNKEILEATTSDVDSAEESEDDFQEQNDEQTQDPGVAFDSLVDRLLSEPKSKADSKFTTVFLCLYRKFAAPSRLIMAIIRRFEELNESDSACTERKMSQLRCLNVLKEWVSDYPGDFAHPFTRRIITSFVQSLATSEDYADAGKEISPHLEIVSEDDDTEWACSDHTRSRANTTESFLTMSSAQSVSSTLNADSPTLTANSSTENVDDNVATDQKVNSKASRISATPSSTSSMSKSDCQSNGSFQTLLNTVENAQRQAQLLTPISRHMLTKIQWRQLMEMPEDQIARELTRIDWIMYSSIRPRDLIRHVSLQPDQKEKCKSLEHVNRMIHQFNHVAFWVTNMILLRDKAKHRAKALEKFMLVAWKLRHLNNYNSLGAVIAGINGTAVHRLSQTRDLIPPEAQKQFMRLEILMGTQKSHFAYRLAFGNTSTSRIPFLPLHRRDLVLAEQANRTFLSRGEGERINWKKFEVMGEVIVTIRRSQDLGYPTINRNEEVQRLVLEGRFCKDDDILFERSVQIEAPAAGEVSKKRFNWFQR